MTPNTVLRWQRRRFREYWTKLSARPLYIEQIAQKLRARVNDVAGVLGRQTVQARQMLRKILADKIELEPVGSGRHPGYKFRGNLSLEKLIAGEAMNNTSDCGGPNGIRHRLQPFQSVASSTGARPKTSRVRNPGGLRPTLDRGNPRSCARLLG